MMVQWNLNLKATCIKATDDNTAYLVCLQCTSLLGATWSIWYVFSQLFLLVTARDRWHHLLILLMSNQRPLVCAHRQEVMDPATSACVLNHCVVSPNLVEPQLSFALRRRHACASVSSLRAILFSVMTGSAVFPESINDSVFQIHLFRLHFTKVGFRCLQAKCSFHSRDCWHKMLG